MMKNIAVIGAGAWGTAIAMVAQRAGRTVILQAREPEVADAVNNRHENTVFLPGHSLHSSITATVDPNAAVAGADAVFLVVPAQHLRTVIGRLGSALGRDVPLIICAKGIEQGTCALMSEVIEETLPGVESAILSGPTFAGEVAAELPTAVTLAMADENRGKTIAEAVGTPYFRIYTSTDIIGAQIGGAVKNVLAIACGIVEGREMGDNTRAALITRGLAEIVRLGRAKGGRAETLMGLSGIGDLTLTCNAFQSRNFSLGVALSEGRDLDAVLKERQSVAEGVFTAASVTDLAKRLGVEIPICAAVDSILNRDADIDKTIHALLSRPFRSEAH